MNAQDKAIYEQLKHALSERNVPLSRLIAFGSKARGDADPESDLDVLVVLNDNDTEYRETIHDCAWEIGFENDTVILPIITTEHALNHSPEGASLLMQNVNREGVAI